MVFTDSCRRCVFPVRVTRDVSLFVVLMELIVKTPVGLKWRDRGSSHICVALCFGIGLCGYVLGWDLQVLKGLWIGEMVMRSSHTGVGGRG